MEFQLQKQYKTSSKILVIGDSCDDVYYYGSCNRLSPEAPVPILKVRKTEHKPGMCLNVAKNLEGLGHEVKILTHDKKIVKHRFVEEKRLVHLLRVDEEPSAVDPASWQQIEKEIADQNYNAIVISDYEKGYITYEIASKISKLVEGKIPIFVDTKKQDISCYSGCVIKINKDEKEKLTKLPSGSYELITTLGEKGAMWNEKIYSTKKSKLYDVCGAGDTFLAALVHEYIRTSSLEKSIYFANKCASISVTHFGNFVMSLQDVD